MEGDQSFMEDLKTGKINPIIQMKDAKKQANNIRFFEYADEWVPRKEDIIFTHIVGAMIAPVSAYHKCDVQSLNYFATSTKKCYNSDLMRDHCAKYLNYLEEVKE